MEKQEKIALINKKMVTEELLYQQACKLTNLSQELKLAVDFIDHLCIDSRVNKDTLNAFVSCGSLSNATDVLQNIQHSISDISNSICPDLDND
jgi:protein-arginine kinase